MEILDAEQNIRYLLEIVKLREENGLLKTRLNEEKKKVEILEETNKMTVRNSRAVVEALHRQYVKKIRTSCAILRKSRQQLQEKDDLIKELSEMMKVLRTEVNYLTTKNLEMGQTDFLKLEELLKLQKENLPWETKQEVKGMIAIHLNEVGFNE